MVDTVQKPDEIGNNLAGAISLRDYLRQGLEGLELHTQRQFAEVIRSNDQRYEDRDKYYESRLERLEAAFNDRLTSIQLSIRIAMEASDAAILAALKASETAVLKAEVATEKRFESVNEFRGALNDSLHSNMPRAEAMTRFDNISEQITMATNRLNLADGKNQGLAGGWMFLVGAIGAVGAVTGIILALQ